MGGSTEEVLQKIKSTNYSSIKQAYLSVFKDSNVPKEKIEELAKVVQNQNVEAIMSWCNKQDIKDRSSWLVLAAAFEPKISEQDVICKSTKSSEKEIPKEISKKGFFSNKFDAIDIKPEISNSSSK